MDLTVKGMDHLHQCDTIWVTGTILQLINMSRGEADFVSEINAYVIYLWEKGVKEGRMGGGGKGKGGKGREELVREVNRVARVVLGGEEDVVFEG